jgi:hypothetical protein
VAVVAVQRNMTGTDESLPFNFSPWPALPIFGLSVGVYLVAGVLYGLALGMAGWALRRDAPVPAWLALATAVVLPGLWLLGRFPSPGAGRLLLLAAATGLSLALAIAVTGRELLWRRVVHVFLGACMLAVPLLAGSALVTGDWTVTKYVRAQRMIDALGAYYQERDEYPDELSQLVDEGYIESIPRPRIGFDFVYALGFAEPIDFAYQSLGSSYVLEFESAEWVQCAYNPPWLEEDEEELEDDEFLEEDDDAWSCPDTRPKLW